MSRQYSKPYIVYENSALALEPVQQLLNEDRLQRFIFEHPNILPIEEIEPVFGPLKPVCREMPTAAGPVDIALINPQGFLTLVECKLWKNPDARRKVVAQILDYAKEINKWTYEDLEQAVRTARKEPSFSLYDFVAGTEEELEEAAFVDAVTRNLRQGRFLLLIVGEGIRESVVAIGDFLQQNALLSFAFALVEIKMFELPAEFAAQGILFQPRILAQTVEIERSVVRIEEDRIVAAPAAPGPSARVRKRPGKISIQVFFEMLDQDSGLAQELRSLLDETAELGIQIVPGQNSLLLKLPLDNQTFNFGVFRTDGTFQNRGIAEQTERIGHPEIGETYLERLAALLSGHVEHSSPNRFYWTVKKDGDYVSIRDILDRKEEFLKLLQRTMNKILEVTDRQP